MRRLQRTRRTLGGLALGAFAAGGGVAGAAPLWKTAPERPPSDEDAGLLLDMELFGAFGEFIEPFVIFLAGNYGLVAAMTVVGYLMAFPLLASRTKTSRLSIKAAARGE